MAWSNQMGNYSIACNMAERPRGTVTVTIVENGQRIHTEEVLARNHEERLEFQRRVWHRVWAPQEEYCSGMMKGLRQEWALQAAE